MAVMVKFDHCRVAELSGDVNECRMRLNGLGLSVEFVQDGVGVDYKNWVASHSICAGQPVLVH